jgi:hypothetical protein
MRRAGQVDHELKASAEEWLRQHIANYRAAVAELTLDRRALSNLDDFSAPCQVHLFWFRVEPNVSYSLLLLTRLKGVQDGLVEVVGPMHPSRAVETLLEVINRDRWEEDIDDTHFVIPADDSSFRRVLASNLAQARANFNKHIVACAYTKEPPKSMVGTKEMMPGNGFTWEIYGDVRCLDSKSLVEEQVRKTKDSALARRRSGEKEHRVARPPRLSGYITRFYPPIWIGDLPIQTYEELLRQTTPMELVIVPKALDAEHRGKKVVVNRDGMIAIESGSRRETLESLNRIMAWAQLNGIDTRTVRESELGTCEIDPATFTIVSWTHYAESPRNPVGTFLHDYSQVDIDLMPITRERVAEDDLRSIILDSEALSHNPYLDNIASLLLEAHTHFSESEYRQCFLMAWMVVEAWLMNEWSGVVDNTATSNKHRQRLEDTRSWTASVVAETLHMLGSIDRAQLKRLTRFRDIRNDVVHRSANPDKEQAKEMLGFATEVTRAAISGC